MDGVFILFQELDIFCDCVTTDKMKKDDYNKIKNNEICATITLSLIYLGFFYVLCYGQL